MVNELELARKDILNLKDNSKVDLMKIKNQQSLIEQQFEIIKDYSEQIELSNNRELSYIERIRRLEQQVNHMLQEKERQQDNFMVWARSNDRRQQSLSGKKSFDTP